MLGLPRERSQVLARSEASVSGEVRNKNHQQQKTRVKARHKGLRSRVTINGFFASSTYQLGSLNSQFKY